MTSSTSSSVSTLVSFRHSNYAIYMIPSWQLNCTVLYCVCVWVCLCLNCFIFKTFPNSRGQYYYHRRMCVCMHIHLYVGIHIETKQHGNCFHFLFIGKCIQIIKPIRSLKVISTSESLDSQMKTNAQIYCTSIQNWNDYFTLCVNVCVFICFRVCFSPCVCVCACMWVRLCGNGFLLLQCSFLFSFQWQPSTISPLPPSPYHRISIYVFGRFSIYFISNRALCEIGK